MDKLESLKALLRKLSPVCIALSGGVDSSFLAAVAKESGAEAFTVTADSIFIPRSEIVTACQTAKELGLPHRTLRISMERRVLENPPKRCYLCKKALFAAIVETAKGAVVCDGSNLDDKDDYRPGRKALEELGVKSPLLMVGYTKEEIRRDAKALGLSNWDAPAAACLASRIPYGTMITEQALSMVEQGELSLKRMGFSQVRVRNHGTVARVEVADFEQAVRKRREIDDALRGVGFSYVALDCRGLRRGSMNEVLV